MNYIVAGAFSKFKEISLFMLKTSFYKRNNVTVYDGINNCPWNGGRINRDIHWKQSQIDFYYKRDISIALTFSNPYIDLTDEVGNALLEKFHKEGNRIILINDDLRQYIRKNYPLYKLTYSITGMDLEVPLTNKGLDFYRDLETKYDLIVPKMEHIFDEHFDVDTPKYEVMLNDSCVHNCPLYKEHFEAIAKQNTLAEKPWEELGHDLCHKVEECWLPQFDPSIDKHGIDGMDLTIEQVKALIKRGFNHFKISGRELPQDEFFGELEMYLEDT